LLKPDLNPSTCLPPSLVLTLLTNEMMFSGIASVYWKAIFTLILSTLFCQVTTGDMVFLDLFINSTN
jgi:hypothetical protein